MNIDRRGVLQGGLAAAAALTFGVNHSQTAQAGTRTPNTAWKEPSGGATGASSTGTQASTGGAGRFPGDPGVGRLYYGASVMASIGGPAALESKLGHILGIHRGYFVASTTNALVRQVADDHAKGRFPHVSTKLPGTWADVAAGRYDAWLLGLMTQIAGPQPVFLTLHHEPENDAGAKGMQPQDWVAMQNRAITMAAGRCPNVTIVPNLMQWTFDPRSGRNPAQWAVPSSRVFSSNVYNAWAPGLKTSLWVSMADKMNMTLPWAKGRPIVIGEYGCRTDPSRPGAAAQWMRDAFSWAQTHGVVSMSYFDSTQHSTYGGWVLDSERLSAMKTLIRNPATAWL